MTAGRVDGADQPTITMSCPLHEHTAAPLDGRVDVEGAALRTETSQDVESSFPLSLGGITGYGSRETTDEDHDRVALLQRLTMAYLRHELGREHSSWSAEQKALAEDRAPPGRLESKG